MRDALDGLSTTPISYVAYMLFGVGLVLFVQHTWTLGVVVSLAGVAIFFGYRWFVWHAFMGHISESLRDDLKNIGKHYRLEVLDGGPSTVPSSPSGFWVVESSLPGEFNEIVGAVGLGEDIIFSQVGKKYLNLTIHSHRLLQKQ